ncbi:kinase-like domain-containing protein, partial [Penicillium riverlandense]|uniref:kinase-like domain-containing protein n=1 Tax=Penicillium riverlandense TaxID=1903569 RepID=UPI0025482E55
IHKKSPWNKFTTIYDCDLAGEVSVIKRRSGATGVQNLRQFPISDARSILRNFRELDHDNIINALEFFEEGSLFYVVSEHYPLTMEHLVASVLFPTENQLGAILSQTLNGLSFIIAQDFKHHMLICSSILMDLKRKPEEKQTSDISGLAKIVMELMQKYAKTDGVVGIDNLDQWPSDSHAVDFLSRTTSAQSVKELQ